MILGFTACIFGIWPQWPFTDLIMETHQVDNENASFKKYRQFKIHWILNMKVYSWSKANTQQLMQILNFFSLNCFFILFF